MRDISIRVSNDICSRQVAYILMLKTPYIGRKTKGKYNMSSNPALFTVTFLPYLYIYLIGVFVYVYRDKILPKLKKCFLPLVALYVVWCIINMHIGFSSGHYANIISGSFVCILTISAGYYFGNHRLKYDFSYSLYLYHMIVTLGITETWYSMVSAYLLTGVLSALSLFC